MPRGFISERICDHFPDGHDHGRYRKLQQIPNGCVTGGNGYPCLARLGRVEKRGAIRIISRLCLPVTNRSVRDAEFPGVLTLRISEVADDLRLDGQTVLTHILFASENEVCAGDSCRADARQGGSELLRFLNRLGSAAANDIPPRQPHAQIADQRRRPNGGPRYYSVIRMVVSKHFLRDPRRGRIGVPRRSGN